MDAESYRLGNENLWAWLVELLSKKPEWLSAKVRFFLPTLDPDCSNEAPISEVTHHQLNRLFAQGPATWESFIYTLCIELEVPLSLEVPLLSIWGQKDEFSKQLGACEESHPGPELHHGVKRPFQSYGSSPRRKHSRKQQLELVKKYLKLLRTSAQQCHGGQCPGAWNARDSPQTYIPPIVQWSGTSAPLDAQEGARIGGDPEAADSTDVSIHGC